ncbi:hypothetical protein QJS10_CPA01g01779 [Acorus calamus]|uniref:Uncharacterized protein n=1 Tax=Acorus calamus TaxID=4465 RepID=A0AAV9FFE7_ACOCL|nr:hypothetical protein QJS10_CPA01g01779 [Acorus calamus]
MASGGDGSDGSRKGLATRKLSSDLGEMGSALGELGRRMRERENKSSSKIQASGHHR